ncbi:dihydroorotate dehydrogenase electron transfer subunit [Ectothiorhodospiraceae bacterium BW-2]|nr:dihydroorotate dehydrogenase electron transfer subunit [Ectothiorhodospiraceae bacterium BW-2]
MSHHRNSLLVEEATLIQQTAYASEQYRLTLHAPKIASRAQAGTFVHLKCAPSLPMRRPISIMRADPDSGTLELLYKVVGEGTRQLSLRQIGESLSLIGPIGRPFQLDQNYPRPLLIGGGVGMPPMIYLAETLYRQFNATMQPLVILGSELPFPFQSEPSKLLLPGLPTEVIATLPLLESWAIPTRLTSLQGYPGCYNGYVTDLARLWLNHLTATQQQQVMLFSCGPTPMLKAVAALAQEYRLPCQISLEEYMACGIGGCAGCVVEVKSKQGVQMRRVCVDGPVFNADEVLF